MSARVTQAHFIESRLPNRNRPVGPRLLAKGIFGLKKQHFEAKVLLFRLFAGVSQAFRDKTVAYNLTALTDSLIYVDLISCDGNEQLKKAIRKITKKKWEKKTDFK